MRRTLACGFALACAVAAGGFARDASAQSRPLAAHCGPAITLADAIARASARFAISQGLIHSVIAAESNFMVRAVSPKGAMGLMQLMPGTWAELRLRYALGADPFDPCDNITAGTAYLRELLDRYGDPGFLAAYNAGPGRYEAYLRGARRLPAETLAYVARLSSAPLGDVAVQSPVAPDPDAWMRGDLFVGRVESASEPVGHAPSAPPAAPNEKSEARPSRSPADAIFVARTGARQ
ncbi:lytic transglycosylase domain-containing protein [Sphingomonas sp. HF-S4]|uniref:Lytic transglycosylase domain-containing protein n=2 Tax=Sphingomonas TaxID=13687 RepID=A0A4V5PTU6_9SPHN|nr:MULTISPECIES: lytic transglycosylase domain-containing protein [Sphingomonas]MDV3458229.1 lytic transglycosylase domain-containing protein [Sphingomonas sp. HF-S4]TKD51448.1 lytic transglycosylase domain-containing protein [Sphingomonas baiyangensis]